jgi:pyruvate, water dikinase
MSNILWLNEISKDSIPKVGGKGANLGEMYNNNFPVPKAFIISAEAYQSFLNSTGIQEQINKILNNLDVENTEQLTEASEKIQDIMLSMEIPQELKNQIIKSYSNLSINQELIDQAPSALQFIRAGRDNPFVAVRSSATAEDLPTASFAGQQETYLNIKGPDQVLQAVHQCWASLYTSRAIYYRVKNNFEHSKVFIAVVVQKMINSEKAGVMFSVNPNTNEEDVLIEASYGLGDAVVSGSISPDQYIIDKKDMKIKDIKVNKKEWMLFRDSNTGRTTKRILNDERANSQVLTEEEINKLARLAVKVENHYKKPQDLEFAIEGHNIYLIQTRPITTIKKIEEVKEENLSEEKPEGNLILSGIPASPGMGAGAVKIVDSLEDITKIEQGDVLVAKMTNPDYVAAMQKASAIVTDEGGTSSHAAIVSREMGIPAVVGTKEATAKLSEGQKITVDGTKGKIFEGISENITPKKEITFEVPDHIPETKTKIKVNLDMSELAEKASMLKPDGIGLMRIEFMIADSKIHPMKYIKENRDDEYTQMLIKEIEKIIQYYKEKPIWVRTSDIRTDEYRNLEGGEDEPHESNPMMGIHGIRKGIREPRLLKAELKAIRNLREKGYKNLGVMLPMVSHLEQIEKTKEILNELNMNEIDLGVMIETPAACFIIHEICKDERIKFISIGSNDLTQFTLAVDRNNSEVQDLYNEMHPAVLRLIKKVVKTAQSYNVQSSICGQAGSNENMAKYLVEIGIDSISVNLDSVNKIRNLVAETEKSRRSETPSGQ